MELKTLKDALLDEMKDIYSAEQQIAAALPKMAKKATDAKLQEGFETHLAETQNQIKRIEKAFELLGEKAEAETCEATKGLLKEGKEIMEKDASPEVMDAMLIAAAQKVEHYEIATYGTMCTWAEELGLKEVHELLGETLNEEENTDKKLSKLAKSRINTNAE